MVDETRLVDPPFVPTAMELVHFNMLFAHLFSVLSGSQSISAFGINPCKHLTVSALLDSTFSVIESTDNQPTPMITFKTVSYIHALIIDTVTLNNSESPYARALRNEQMVTQELDEMDPHKFRSESVKYLADYYEKVRDMEGAEGLHCVKSFKHKFKDIGPPTLNNIEASSSQAAAGGRSGGHAAARQEGPCHEGEGDGALIRMK
jgi:hypothetical protein